MLHILEVPVAEDELASVKRLVKLSQGSQ